MANIIKLKQSNVLGKVPQVSDLVLGEPAINTVDGRVYIKKSVDGVESIVDVGNNQAIADVQSDVSGLQSDVSSLQSDVSTAQGDISSLQSDVSAAQSSISTLQSDVSTAQGDISALQSSVSGAQGDISALQSDLSTEAATRLANDNTLQSNIDAEVTARIADVNAEESRAIAAETALENKINSLGNYDKETVFVDSVNGVDAVGNGTLLKPFKTINYAYSQVPSVVGATDLDKVTQFVSEKLIFDLAPGTYNENVEVGFKRARVALVGNGARIIGTVKCKVLKSQFPVASLESFKPQMPAPWTGTSAQMCFEIAGEAGGGLEGDATANIVTVTGLTSLEFENGGANYNWDNQYGQFYCYFDNVNLCSGFNMVHDNTVATARAPAVVVEIESSKIGNGDSATRSYVGYVPFGASTTVPSYGGITLKAHNSTFGSVLGPSITLGEIDGCRIYDIDRTMGAVVTNGSVSGSTSTSYVGIVNTQFRAYSGAAGSSVYKIGATGSNVSYKIDSVSHGTLTVGRTLDVAAGRTVTYTLLDRAAGVLTVPAGNLASTTVQAALEEHQGDIDSINTSLASKASTADLTTETNARIAGDNALQSSINSVQSSVTTLQSNLTTAQNNISTLQSDVATAQGNISTLQSNVTTLQGSVTTLQSDVSSLATDISAAEGDIVALDVRIDALEATPRVQVYSDYTALPGTGAEEVVYITADNNEMYRWEVVTLPESYDFTIGATGNFASLEAALASASVQNGHKLFIQAGLYNVASTINITKQVKIYGAGVGDCVFTTAGAGSDPVSMFNVSVDNVLMKGLAIQHRKTTNTSVETAVVVSGGGFPQTRVANFIMDDCRVEHVEFAVTVRGSDWKLANCQFAYEGPNNSTRRHIGVYGVSGNCFIVNNASSNNASTGSLRWVQITSTTGTNPNETLVGKLIVQNNSQTYGALAQFISQDAWQGSAGSFELLVKNNSTTETSAFLSLYGTAANFGDILSSVTVSGNSLSNTHGGTNNGGKGIIGVDGTAAFRSTNLVVHAAANTLANATYRTDYVAVDGTTVGRNTVIPAFSASTDSSIPANPTEPTTPSAGGGTSEEYVALTVNTLDAGTF